MATAHARAPEFTRTTFQKAQSNNNGCPSAFMRLPDEIIEEILLLADPNGFSSLVLLNNQWRRVSQQAYLYAHQLSKLPSSSKPIDFNPAVEDKLAYFRNRFIEEARRNLFDSYIRPRETVIKLVSTSTASSSSFPGGEAFQFSFSPAGRFLLAYTSSRLYMLDIDAEDIEVAREFKISRRPVAATVLDDGSLLAVLSSDHQVDVYSLAGQTTKHVKALALVHPPRTIALSPEGSVLAVAYDGGIEVYSLAAQTQAVDRRAVKCDAADSLTFSTDGTQLLGTTLQSRNPNTVVLCAPYYDDDVAASLEGPQQSWTTSILFPNSSRDCSHAVLLPNPSDYEASWTFTYDRVFESFRAVRVDDLRNGTTYFHGPAPTKSFTRKLLPHTLPAASDKGEMVAAGFEGREIWLYGVPGDLDAIPEVEATYTHYESELSTPQSNVSRRNSQPFQPRNFSRHLNPDATSRALQRQLLSDQARNNFVEGRKLTEFADVTAMKWVVTPSRSNVGQRLAAVAPGTMDDLTPLQDELTPCDNGRILLLDFAYSVRNGEKRMITIEVGENEPEVLEEEKRDMELEVALARRRSIAMSTMSRISINGLSDPFVEARPQTSHQQRRPSITFPQPETDQDRESFEDPRDALETPYTQGDTRSGTSLRRAATIAATNRRFVPRGTAQEQTPFRRPGGQEEMPHESDADEWVPPPPPYTTEKEKQLPERLRNAVSPIPDHVREYVVSPVEDIPEEQDNSGEQDNSRHQTSAANLGISESEYMVSANVSVDSLQASYQLSQGFMNSQLEDDIYDVSPPGSPILSSVEDAENLNSIVISPPEDPTRTAYITEQVPSTEIITRISSRPAPLDLSATQEFTSDSVTRPGHENLLSPKSPDVTTSQPRTPDTATDSMFSDDSRPQTPQDYVRSPKPKDEPVVVDGIVMPTASQVERLNSRTGRPPTRVLSDPSRKRRSTSNPSSTRSRNTPSPTQSQVQDSPPGSLRTSKSDQGIPTIAVESPAKAIATAATPPRPTVKSYRTSSPNSLGSRRISPVAPSSNSRYSTSTPNLRPRMYRLETIHSQTSNEDLSEANKSASLLHPDGTFDGGKRRGWRGSFKRKQRPQRPQIMKRESADWNELLKQSQAQKEDSKKKKKKKRGKCVVM